jgi:hypothetical protein
VATDPWFSTVVIGLLTLVTTAGVLFFLMRGGR